MLHDSHSSYENEQITLHSHPLLLTVHYLASSHPLLWLPMYALSLIA